MSALLYFFKKKELVVRILTQPKVTKNDALIRLAVIIEDDKSCIKCGLAADLDEHRALALYHSSSEAIFKEQTT